MDPVRVRFENVALNLPERQADDLLLIETPNPRDRWALLLEHQTRPEPKKLKDWLFKANAAGQVLGCPVILAVVYLERGRYATFPDRYEIQRGGLRNSHEFETVRLWDHADRIANGDLPELAPLLLLASPEKTVAVLQQERRLILDLPIGPEQRRDFLAVATMVGTRYFDTGTLARIFREEMSMLKEAGFIQEWIIEGLEKGHAQGLAEGRAKGREEGREEGEATASRRALVEVLETRFGPLRSDIQVRIEALNAKQCLRLLSRALRADSLSELGF